MLDLYGHIACCPCELYICGSHICSLIYVYSAPCLMVEVSDFIFGIYMCVYPPYMHVRYLAHMHSNYINIMQCNHFSVMKLFDLTV